MQITVLTSPEASLTALKELGAWAQTIDMAYAWATSANGTAKHWNAVPLSKVRRALIGVHFGQTEPEALRLLHAQKVLKVIASTTGVFHPKITIAKRGRHARVLTGSSNFTNAAFSRNTELNVLVEGPIDAPEISDFCRFFEEQWSGDHAEIPSSAWMDTYEEVFRDRPHPPTVPTVRGHHPVEFSELTTGWSSYSKLLRAQDDRALWTGWHIHLFEHEDGSYLEEIEACHAAFRTGQKFEDLSRDVRARVSGFGSESSGYLGSMRGAGTFKNIVLERPRSLGKFLDKIPHAGPVSEKQVSAYLSGSLSLTGVGVATASRLLCVKRPDLFFSANAASAKELKRVFGVNSQTPDGYLAIFKRISTLTWARAATPEDAEDARLWRARVALLDALFYEPT